jgi:hypothetical protein
VVGIAFFRLCISLICSFSVLEGATRVVFGRQAVQSGARKSRVDQNHCLDDLFEGRMVELKHKPKKKKADSETEDSDSDLDGLKDILRPVVVCADPQEFLHKVMLERNMDVANTDIKVLLDELELETLDYMLTSDLKMGRHWLRNNIKY